MKVILCKVNFPSKNCWYFDIEIVMGSEVNGNENVSVQITVEIMDGKK